jgi:hypothetical protein
MNVVEHFKNFINAHQNAFHLYVEIDTREDKVAPLLGEAALQPEKLPERHLGDHGDGGKVDNGEFLSIHRGIGKAGIKNRGAPDI